MIPLLLDIKAEVDAAPLDQMSLSPGRLAYFEQHYDELIDQGLQANPPPDTPKGSLSELRPLPPCGIIRLPNRGRGEGLFYCPLSLSLGWLD